MFILVVVDSDKTTVSVGTGQNEYWPLYGSIGNIHNNVRRVHRAGLVLIAFLAIPKGNSLFLLFVMYHFFSFAADNVYSSDPTFHTFCQQLFHTLFSKIFSSLQPVIDQPEIVQCPDRNYRHGIWGFGAHIGNYLEQTLMACIVQGWCARYEI